MDNHDDIDDLDEGDAAMMGKSHVVAGPALLALTYAGVQHAASWSVVREHEWLHGPVSNAAQWLTSVAQPADWPVWMYVLGAGLLLLGALLPDMDHPRSTLGRWLHIPVRHGGLTHGLWAVMFWVLIAIIEPTGLGWWLAAGMWSHSMLDDLSVGGTAWLYPLLGYKVIERDGVEVVVRKVYGGLYSTGTISEVFVVIGLWLATAAVYAPQLVNLF